jgi:hypothetical protein
VVALLTHCLNPPKALLTATGQDPPIDDVPSDGAEPLGVRELTQIQHRKPRPLSRSGLEVSLYPLSKWGASFDPKGTTPMPSSSAAALSEAA